MKTTIITLLGLLLLSTVAGAQQFRERGRTPQGRRPAGLTDPERPPHIPPRYFCCGCTSAVYIGSIGQNGMGGSSQGQSSNEVLLVIAGTTQQTIWTFDFQTILGVDDIKLAGFFKFKEDESVQAVLSTAPDENNNLDFWIVNVADKAVEFSMQGVQPRLVADLDGEGGPEIIVYIPNERVVSVIGYDDGGSTSNIAKSSAHPGSFTHRVTASNYQLTLKFESQRRRRLAFDRRLFPAQRHFDFDLDGRIDIPVLVENANGDAVGMEVWTDMRPLSMIWEYTFPQENIADIRADFHGFADVNGDGETEAFLGNNLAVTLDGTLHVIDPNFEIRIVYDVDNDGFPDLVGVNPADTTVQVWGLESATSVSEEDLIVAGFQLEQNYPNPFNPSTTINYSIEKTGLVELKIYDLLGKEVRSLVNGNKPSGEFSVFWDGKDDGGRRVASGHYFYQLKAGEFQSTRRMILLK